MRRGQIVVRRHSDLLGPIRRALKMTSGFDLNRTTLWRQADGSGSNRAIESTRDAMAARSARGLCRHIQLGKWMPVIAGAEERPTNCTGSTDDNLA